jgi:hypothetical protein
VTPPRAQVRREEGWAVLTAVIVLGIVISLSLPLLSLIDSQQRQTAQERRSESSFNLAEAAYDATVFVLANDWPSVSTGLYPETCTADTTSVKCPSADLLARSYSGTDYSNRGWTIRVRDDVDGSEYYDEARVEATPTTWDANGNARMWVRADAHAAGRDRTVIALVRRTDKLVPFPRNILTSGWFATGNTGRKVIVNTRGNAAQPAPLAVRCTLPAPSTSCLNFLPDRGQVSPDTTTTGYQGQTAIPVEAFDQLRAKAKTLGTYYASGCPPTPAGELVFVESGTCNYKSGKTFNSQSSPGLFVLARGTITFGGGMTYYGLIYAANLQRTTASVVTLSGAATIFGSIAVDGPGGTHVGSNGENFIYDDRVFGLVKAFGGAATVQGTWRELPAS